MTTATHPTTAKNAAHRNDLTWLKTGKREVSNYAGYVIKWDCMAWAYVITNPTGERIAQYTTLTNCKTHVDLGW